MSIRLTTTEIAQLIEHSVLDPMTTQRDVELGCTIAKELGVAGLVVFPCWVATARELLPADGVALVSVISFPWGTHHPSVTVAEATRAIDDGADELDMVLPLGRFRSDGAAACLSVIADVVQVAGDRVVKVIIETAVLNSSEIRHAARLVVDAGAAFVKTSTGFASGGATVAAVRMIRDTVGNRARIKASGGIRSAEAMAQLVSAGADRIGTSATAAILRQWNEGAS